MTVAKLTRTVSFVFVCLLVFAFTSVSPQAHAQGVLNKAKEGVQKGAEGVKKGAETVGEKTKEGVETTGREVKKVFTGDDTDREKGTQTQEPATMPSTTTPTTTAPSTTTPTTTMPSTKTHSRYTGTHTKTTRKELPRTAGELSLLALAGGLALAGAGVSKVRSTVKSK
jgi:hypothetical protein